MFYWKFMDGNVVVGSKGIFCMTSKWIVLYRTGTNVFSGAYDGWESERTIKNGNEEPRTNNIYLPPTVAYTIYLYVWPNNKKTDVMIVVTEKYTTTLRMPNSYKCKKYTYVSIKCWRKLYQHYCIIQKFGKIYFNRKLRPGISLWLKEYIW